MLEQQPAGGQLTTLPPAPPVAAPQLAVSMHAWDPYYLVPGPAEKPSPQLTQHLDALAAINALVAGTVSFVRVDMGWSASQPKNTPTTMDNYYNRRFARLFAEIISRGLRPFVVVHQSPAWARPKHPGDVKQFPDDPGPFGEWAHWLTQTFAPLVKHWEVWNEPNLDAFTGAGRNTPAEYVKAAAAFAAGARAGDPNCQLIGPNVSQSDWSFTDQCYQLGLGNITDIIGVHPYQGRQSVAPASTDITGITAKAIGWEKARITAGLPLIYRTMTRYGDTCKPIWATEVGWSASATGVGTTGVGPKGTWPTIEDKAAAFISDMLAMFTTGRDAAGTASAAAYQRLAVATIYEAFDPLSTNPHQKGFEILTAAGGLKPQAKALAEFRRKYPRVRAAA